MATPSDAITQDDQQKELLRFLDKSRARFSKLLQRWSCGDELFTSSRDYTSQKSATAKSNLFECKPQRATNDKPRGQDQFPPSCATKSTLRMTAEATEELLGMPYPGDARNIEDLQVNYTPAQRLVIYADIISRVPTAPELKLNALHGIAEYDELNASRVCESGLPKRRYRVSRPTFNEELHDLVELQMTALCNKTANERATNRRETEDCTSVEMELVLRNKAKNVRKKSRRDERSSDYEHEYSSRSKQKSKHDQPYQSRREHTQRHEHKRDKSHKRSRDSSGHRSKRRSSRTPSRPERQRSDKRSSHAGVKRRQDKHAHSSKHS